MSEQAIHDWQLANQAYLMTSLKAVQQQLERYIRDRKQNGQGNDNKTSRAIRDSESPQEGNGTSALEIVTQLFGLSQFEKNVLLMCAGVELDSSFADLVSKSQDNRTGLPCFSLALSALEGAHWSALAPQAPLRYWRLVELTDRHLVAGSPAKIDEHILHYLAGIRFMDDKLTGIVRPLTSDIPLVASHQVLVQQVVNDLHGAADALPVIALSGSNTKDKESIAAEISARVGFLLYTLSVSSIPTDTRDVFDLARLWSREAALKNGILYLDVSDVDRDDKQKMNPVHRFVENIQGIVILNSETLLPEFSRRILVYNIDKPDKTEQVALWTAAIGHDDDSLRSVKQIVSQFDLSTKTIAAVTTQMKQEEDFAMSNDERLRKVWQSCCVNTRPQIAELAARIEPVATIDDLVLPEAQKENLRELIMQVRHRTTVYTDWGFAARGGRGLGITALFSGESGTGKTMAAEVIANELSLDLYRIDLSQVVNKYIGETEKNLKKIFDAADDGGAILLFDEADALFGKRSEVKDSHDRYANMEVSYLLQRMEAYRGLAILTTNMKNTLDKAWMRRIRFVIQFPFPDLLQRAEIWKRIFPAETPTLDLEIEKLAKLNIAGGNIRNIALNAAFIAANEDKAVTMSHLSRAMRREYIKLEKHLNNIETII